MFDSQVRVQKVADLYGELLKAFESHFKYSSLPQNKDEIYGTVGFPSRRARGKHDLRLGAEIIQQDWQGVEKAMLSLHPEKTKDVESAAWSVLYAMLRASTSPRQARAHLDNYKNMPDAVNKVKQAAQEVGSFPDGFVTISYTPRDSNRMRKYTCSCGKIIRAADDNLKAQHVNADGTVCGDFTIA